MHVLLICCCLESFRQANFKRRCSCLVAHYMDSLTWEKQVPRCEWMLCRSACFTFHAVCYLCKLEEAKPNRLNHYHYTFYSSVANTNTNKEP